MSLQTKKIKGLHESDFIMAAKLDRMADEPPRRSAMSAAAETPLTTPAAERNKGPILAVLKRVLPASGLVLEIASGTGQHAIHFARELPQLIWQPSEPDPGLRASIRAWVTQAGLPNVRGPLDLDVHTRPWAVETADAVVCINMIHIAPWSATAALMSGACRLLRATGV